MNAKVILSDIVPNQEPTARVEIIAASENEIRENSGKIPEWFIALLIELMNRCGIRLISIDFKLPPAVVVVTVQSLGKRCAFLGITGRQTEVMAGICNGEKRSRIAETLPIGIDCVNSHYQNVKKLVGAADENELIHILTCPDEDYLENYYQRIEAYKSEMNINYRKKYFT